MAADFTVDLHGTTAVVTGATTGIGKEIARGLVRLGAHLVIGARDATRGEAARRELGSDAVSVLPVDVAETASVRTFATAVRDQYDGLDLLVNNAGAWFSDRRQTSDGRELTFATNVLGPYLLTTLLAPALRARPHARVVNIVSSIAGNYDANDLQFSTRPYDGYAAYAQSKQALRMLTEEFAERFAGTGITVNSAAPGFVRTEFNRNARGMRAAMINLSVRLFAVSPVKGADTPLWACVAPELRDTTGGYFVGRQAKDGGFHDRAAREELARRCEELLALA
jgi:NAD(P)-dependent dehydrogenase (short-subunit alcohol dehydrogenase family)